MALHGCIRRASVRLCIVVVSVVVVGLPGLMLLIGGPGTAWGQTEGETDEAEKRPGAASSVLERQHRAYEAFQDRRRSDHESFRDQRRAAYETYMERMHSQLQAYQRIVDQVQQAERERIAQRWDEPELSSAKVWVEYDADLGERRRVDFEQQSVSIETLAGGQAPASPDAVRTRLRRTLRALLIEDRATAFERDALAQAVETRSLQEIELLETAEVSRKPILWPYLMGQDEVDDARLELTVDLLLDRVEMSETRTDTGERLQQATIPLEPDLLLAQLERLEAARMDRPVPESPLRPSMGHSGSASAPVSPIQPPSSAPRPRLSPPPSLPPRARAFADPVDLYGARFRLDPALVYAIIETESAFNPVARSPVPAYGLMQIVPQSAGQDATEALFGRPRILAPSYLYDAEKNIEIGTAFLEILSTRYLAGIQDPQSRLYCAIAAYNTGHGNVFKAFTGRMRPKAAFERINRMTPSQVYDHLVRHLPYAETRRYLPKVVARLSRYREWIDGPS